MGRLFIQYTETGAMTRKMAGKKIPQRKCAGCAQMKDNKELIRLVREAESGLVLVDPTGRKNGRGCYVCRDLQCIENARKTHGIERSLKCSISAPQWEALLMEINTLAGK